MPTSNNQRDFVSALGDGYFLRFDAWDLVFSYGYALCALRYAL
jgi:hypothetical protein